MIICLIQRRISRDGATARMLGYSQDSCMTPFIVLANGKYSVLYCITCADSQPVSLVTTTRGPFELSNIGTDC